ncbi:MAG: HipA domain-containing protein [Pseudobdellovibrionaceae bacterium]|nr:MAG: HipA domain-containing protein [Pseudobdellovibrionaceae bacterium]
MTELKDVVELKIFRGELFAGILRRTQRGCELTFDPSFFKNPKYQTLTYKIKKQERPYTHHGVNLPPFFAGLLPEGLRFKALVSELKTSEDDLFTLLAASGTRVIGDVYTVASGIKNRNAVEIPKVSQIDFYEFFQQNIKAGLYETGDEAIAGVQEKLSASMISFPVRAAKENKSYILKLNPKDKPNLIFNEYQCLRLAKKCGIEVNSAKIVYDKNGNGGLLIERFDRVVAENNIIQKVHQEDACQFLDRYPADKYRLSFQEICTGLHELATAPAIETSKAIQLYVFSYLIGNGDLHAKNISLQTNPDTGRIQLTPAYDLICTYLYKDRKMAIKLDGRDDNLKRQHFVDFGLRFGLKEKAIHHFLDQLLEKVKKHQHLLFEIPGLSAKEETLLREMTDSRFQHLR